MEEGLTVDFKRQQYPFRGATNDEKDELLKDVLSFANSDRYRTAYILIGVEEITGGSNEIVGVSDHLEDADLHQFVNSKTNRHVEFSYFPHEVEGKEIGIISIPIQDRPFYTRRNFGKVLANAVYMRDGSSTRHASPDEIADMGRSRTPRLVEWSLNRLKTMARHAVVATAEHWRSHPRPSGTYEVHHNPLDYSKARDWVLRTVDQRTAGLNDYPPGMDSYGSLSHVFTRFENLLSSCAQTIRTIGPALIESGALVRAIVELEDYIDSEKIIWDGFQIRMDGQNTPLPGEANFNLLSVAARTIRFIDVLEDEDQYGNPDHRIFSPFQLPVRWRSPEWGDWRR